MISGVLRFSKALERSELMGTFFPLFQIWELKKGHQIWKSPLNLALSPKKQGSWHDCFTHSKIKMALWLDLESVGSAKIQIGTECFEHFFEKHLLIHWYLISSEIAMKNKSAKNHEKCLHRMIMKIDYRW